MKKKKTIAEGWRRHTHKQRGLTMVEYALAGGLVSAGVIAAFAALGIEIGVVIDAIVQLIEDAVS